MSIKNNSRAQKAAWKANQTIGSRRMKFYDPQAYHPKPKEPSRRDLHRAAVAASKLTEEQRLLKDPVVAELRQALKPPFPAVRHFARTAEQLRKVARRIPKVRASAMRALLVSGLTDAQVRFHRARMAGAQLAENLLNNEVCRRNINGTAFRDATPWKLRRQFMPATA